VDVGGDLGEDIVPVSGSVRSLHTTVRTSSERHGSVIKMLTVLLPGSVSGLRRSLRVLALFLSVDRCSN